MKLFPLRCLSSHLKTEKKPSRLSLLWGLAILFFLACALYLPPVLSVSTAYGDRELPIYCVDTDLPAVSLTFDGAWGDEDLSDILSILADQNVRATFFLSGDWMRQFPEGTRAIAAGGHDIGSHGDHHLDMVGLSADELQQELTGTKETLYSLTGQSMDLFRPPYGSYDNNVIEQATSFGYFCIQWSVDSLDWKNYGTEAIIDRVLQHKNLKNGAIILLHNGAKYTASALEELIVGIKAFGYDLVPVSELIYRDNYHMEHDGTQVPNSP